MKIRTVENIALSDVCPHCERRIWYTEDSHKSSRRYFAPKWMRMMVANYLGRNLLGTYYLDKCEVCDRTVAVFDRNSGKLYGEVIVLYACTLLSVPLPSDECSSCDDNKSCYGCELKKGELYVTRQ